jgi:hypothetical protein
MLLDPEFVADCPYGPGGLLIDELVSVDREQSLVRALMPVHEDLPITREQRVHPELHPRHISGGLMIHVTGMMGFLHAYYVLDLRHRDGWIGYGTHIHEGKFKKLGRMGRKLELECRAVQQRKVRGSIFARYRFRFTQGDDLIYEGDQSAIFTQIKKT